MTASAANPTDTDVKLAAEQWLCFDREPATRAAISDWLAVGDTASLRAALWPRIQFGTAGLRAAMGAGYARINALVVVQTAQGIVRHLQCQAVRLGDGVVVGHDARHNSCRFAQLTAAIFLHAGIPVHLFSQIIPTPFIPFAVRHLKCALGIMVTASHNPKEDNGYKVYGSNGAQIIAPTDKQIQQQIMANLEPWPTSWDVAEVIDRVSDPLQEVMSAYMAGLESSIPPTVLADHTSDIAFTYTPLHGVGQVYMAEAFKRLNLRLISTPTQSEPHPDFPTVTLPNPEEGRGCLLLAMRQADENGSQVVLANDPDADRLAVVEKSDGEWRIFTGNELGALLGWWAVQCCPPADRSRAVVMSSTVSSRVLEALADRYGCRFEETLTGFKWMGNRALQLEPKEKVLFAFEEAIGFMFGTRVPDKDGISAACHLAGLYCHLKRHFGRTLGQQLAVIYGEVGWHTCANSYFKCDRPAVIAAIFERLRRGGQYPKELKVSATGQVLQVLHVRDLTTGYDSEQPDQTAILPTSAASQMITFKFSNGLVATLRTSGTEPKIKYYTELCCRQQEKQVDATELSRQLNGMVEALVEDFLQPEVNGLLARSAD